MCAEDEHLMRALALQLPCRMLVALSAAIGCTCPGPSLLSSHDLHFHGHTQIVACTPGRMIDLLVTSGGASELMPCHKVVAFNRAPFLQLA